MVVKRALLIHVNSEQWRVQLAIVELLRKGISYTVIAEKYGIAQSTVANIKKNGAKVDALSANNDECEKLL